MSAPALATRRMIGVSLLLAAATRAWQIGSEAAYLHPDALGQALEPAFRAVFGYGEVAWEFRDGLRNWLVPGLYLPAFGLAKLLGAPGSAAGMAPYVALARGIGALVDLAALALAMGLTARMVAPRGRALALAWVGLLGALHPAFAVMGAQPLVDVPASTLLLAGVWLSGGSHPRAGAAAAAALTLCGLLRPQLAPAVGIVLLAGLIPSRWGPDWLVARQGVSAARWTSLAGLRRDRRGLLLGAGAALLLVACVDWATWGTPLHSLVAYLRYNLGAGQTAFGVMPADRYLAHFALAMPVGVVLLPALAIFGARTAPLLLLLLLAVVLPHQLVPYKVWRFLHPALWLLLILSGVGVGVAADALAPRLRDVRMRRLAAIMLIVVGAAGAAAAMAGETLWQTTWLWHQGGAEAVERSRALNAAALRISALSPPPARCLQAVLPREAAPGAALFGHSLEVLHPLGGSRPDGAALRAVDCFVLPPDAGQPSARFVAVPGPALPAGVGVWRAAANLP